MSCCCCVVCQFTQYVSENVDNELLLLCCVSVHTVPSNQNILHHLTGLRLLLPSTSDSAISCCCCCQSKKVSYNYYNPHRHLSSSLLLVIVVAGCDGRLCHPQSRVINDIRSVCWPICTSCLLVIFAQLHWPLFPSHVLQSRAIVLNIFWTF